MQIDSWDYWVDEALSLLNSMKIVRSLRPIHIVSPMENDQTVTSMLDEVEVYQELQHWDRSSVEVQISESTFRRWISDVASTGHDSSSIHELEHNVDYTVTEKYKKLLLFSGNDYLGLSSHPMIRKAAAKVALDIGMGPRGSALICGYTNFHRSLESSLANLKEKEDCLLCPTGFSANMAVMVAIGNIGSLLAKGRKPGENEKIAIFSDALNHASIIDGIRLSQQRNSIQVFVYKHCDVLHLHALLSRCSSEKKVVVTDGLFSMDGDFAPLPELSKLREIHDFLLVIDDAHGTFVCGEKGGGVAEMFECGKDVDICTGTLSKAAGCQGGFIACSKKWKQLIQSTGRAFIFSTAMPVPLAAAASAAVFVSKNEAWRRKELRKRVREFEILTGVRVSSHIISLIVGSEDRALEGSRLLLKAGFHVTAIRPPTVAPNSCRLRVTLSAAHTREDLMKLASGISRCINLRDRQSLEQGSSARL